MSASTRNYLNGLINIAEQKVKRRPWRLVGFLMLISASMRKIRNQSQINNEYSYDVKAKAVPNAEARFLHGHNCESALYIHYHECYF